jgi:RNA polymerase subunit RPABC4/transcription elongation factor Spt4
MVGAPKAPTETIVRSAGYGLPCAKCKAYYPADLNACPICRTTQRVSPKATVIVNVTAEPPVAETPELEEERERFLREFRSQMLAANTEISSMGSFKCTMDENHDGEYEAASICQGCYDKLQERVDVLEAAVHMDVKEAAQIVYDAVWADTSDTTKTYQNAAHALLVEIRKRAGVALVLGPLQRLPH